MTIEIIDRRSTAPTDDASRQSRRDSIKQRLAAAGDLQRQFVTLREEIVGAEREIEVAAQAHQVACQALQSKLSCAADEAERRKSRAEIDAENEVLETRLRQLRSRIKLLSSEADALGRQREVPEILFSELMRLASPELKHQHFSTQQAMLWSQHRLREAQSQVARWSDAAAKERSRRAAPRYVFGESFGRRQLETPPAGETELIYAERLSRWQAEAAAANEAVTEAKHEEEKARRACLDE